MEPTTEASAAAPPPPPLRDTYFTEKQLAKELPKCSVRKLRTWRSLRIGPKWFRCGREVCYLRTSVEAWIRENEIGVERESKRSGRK